jgi:phosphatidate cytidylyltransferase
MAIQSKLAKRLFFGSILTLAFAGLLVGEGWLAARDYFCLPTSLRGLFFALLACIVADIGCVELRRLALAKGLQPSLAFMILAVSLVILHPFWSHIPASEQNIHLLAGLFIALLFLAAMIHACRHGTQDALAHFGFNCFTIIYLGIGMWFLLALRLLQADSPTLWDQSGPVIMFIACVKSTDIGAYFTGRLCGKHKWVPAISPGKTWEGLAGGVVLAIIVSSLFAALSGIISIADAIIFGFVVAVAGQLGDLMESMLKRDAGSKDSAHLVPEFGGVLDVLDSILIAAPFAYLILSLTR